MLCSACKNKIPDIGVAALRAKPDPDSCACDHTLTAIAVRKGELEAAEAIRETQDSKIRELIEAVMAGAECDLCEKEPAPVTQLRITRYEDGEVRVTWWCHGEEYGGKRDAEGKADSNATATFFAGLRQLMDPKGA